MNRREEIMSDRKLLNALLEKYGKKDIMQFLDANFDDDNETSYFDTFSKEDAAYKEMVFPAQALIKEWQNNRGPYLETQKKYYLGAVHKGKLPRYINRNSAPYEDKDAFPMVDFFHRLMNFVKPRADKLFGQDPEGQKVKSLYFGISETIDLYYKKVCEIRTKLDSKIREWYKNTYEDRYDLYRKTHWEPDFIGDVWWTHLYKFIDATIIYICIFRILCDTEIIYKNNTEASVPFWKRKIDVSSIFNRSAVRSNGLYDFFYWKDKNSYSGRSEEIWRYIKGVAGDAAIEYNQGAPERVISFEALLGDYVRDRMDDDVIELNDFLSKTQNLEVWGDQYHVDDLKVDKNFRIM